MSNFNVDADFSVYALTKRSMNDTAIMNHRRTMSVISNEIENATLIDDASNVIFSSFQIMSKFLLQADRYRQIAQKAKHVYVFGVVDCALPKIDNLTYVPIQPDDQLAKEWFIVSFGEEYFCALATEELTNIYDADHKREFKGIWSFDVFLVGILHEWLSGIVGLRGELQDVKSHDYFKQAALVSNTIGRMSVRVMDHSSDKVIENELSHIMKHSLQPAYHNLKNQTQETSTVDTSTRRVSSA